MDDYDYGKSESLLSDDDRIMTGSYHNEEDRLSYPASQKGSGLGRSRRSEELAPRERFPEEEVQEEEQKKLEDPEEEKKLEDPEEQKKQKEPEKAKKLQEQEQPQEGIYLFHKHFRCAEHDHPPTNNKVQFIVHDSKGKNKVKKKRELWEANTYRYEFNFFVFFKAFTISVIDILGLKVLLYFYKWISGSKFLDNFYRFGIINFCINLFGWINMVLVLFSIYQKTFLYADASILGYMVGLLFLSIIGASEMSFLNRKIPDLLQTVELTQESRIKDRLLKEVRIEDELKKTILRLNFDASSFFMSFIEHDATNAILFPRELLSDSNSVNINYSQGEGEQYRNVSPMREVGRAANESLKNVSSSKNILIEVSKRQYGGLTQNMSVPIQNAELENIEIQNQQDQLISKKPVQKPDLLKEAEVFEYEVFYYKFLTEPSSFDKKKAYAYRYAKDILQAYRPSFPYALFLMVVGVIGTIVVSLMKFHASNLDCLENDILGYFVKGFLLLLNAIVTVAILFLISKGTHIIWDRLCFIKGMSELLSEDQPPADSVFRKDGCPMLNIFDFESLRTWASLRMIFMNLNQKRLEAISLAISIIVTVQLTTIAILGFFYFTSSEPQKALFLQYIIFFGTPTIVYMVFVLLFISIGAQVNNQYQEHIYRLKTLKITIYKLFALFPSFFKDKPIKPSTYLFARGFRYLQDEWKNEDITPLFLKANLEIINEAYDTIITELEIEEQHRPLKLLGIPMTDSFAGTVFGTILTVIMIPVGKYLAEITGWD